MLDHGHEAAVCRDENKTLAFLRHVTFVAKDLPKMTTLKCLAPFFSMMQPLSENATVLNSIAVALFMTNRRPFQMLGGICIEINCFKCFLSFLFSGLLQQ
jgi:hypothetical protein